MRVSEIFSVPGLEDGGAGAVDLADRFTSALAKSYVSSGQELEMLRAASNDPHVAANPTQLFALQMAVGEYTKRMTVAAGLANHATKTIETLLKS